MAFDLLSFLLGKSTGSGGGGGSAALGPKTIRQNGVYRAASDNLDGYNTVTVEVPNTYAAADEGKVVSNGALVAQTSRTITENGTFDTTLNNEVVVNVPSGGDLDKLIDGSITAVESGVSVVEEYKFYNCTSLTTVNLTGAVWIKGNAFRGCAALQSFNAKYATRVFGYAFRDVPADALVFPHLTGEIGANAFDSWKGTKLDLNGTDFELKLNALNNAVNFDTLIIRKNTRVILANINAFNGTPFASGGTGGTLYVPQSLLSQYEQAANWSTILGYENNQILPIEGSIYENAYADGTPIT